ncbi:MAG: hypothetical protein EOO90_03320 [Pedobacter sp.]|nr:MAG: hypothetical protein EOO90_03320 [Pedobacter sp.]
MRLLFLFIICLIPVYTNGQIPAKIEDDSLFGKDRYYLKQISKVTKPKGVLVLIPGYGEHPYAVSAQTSILQEAEKNGLAVIMVNLTPNNEDLPINDTSLSTLANMIKHFYKEEKLPSSTNLYIGGFSIGGTAAMRFYTKKNREFTIKKVFAIDPPLDMVRLKKSLSKGREQQVIQKLDLLISENVDKDLALQELSVYNPSHPKPEKLPNYEQTALRIYCEPDILWWIKNRNMDLSDMNVTDCAGYVNAILKKDRNQKAELILTKGMGIRNGDQVHPHSWSIAEPADLVWWLLKE